MILHCPSCHNIVDKNRRVTIGETFLKPCTHCNKIIKFFIKGKAIAKIQLTKGRKVIKCN